MDRINSYLKSRNCELSDDAQLQLKDLLESKNFTKRLGGEIGIKAVTSPELIRMIHDKIQADVDMRTQTHKQLYEELHDILGYHHEYAESMAVSGSYGKTSETNGPVKEKYQRNIDEGKKGLEKFLKDPKNKGNFGGQARKEWSITKDEGRLAGEHIKDRFNNVKNTMSKGLDKVMDQENLTEALKTAWDATKNSAKVAWGGFKESAKEVGHVIVDGARAVGHAVAGAAKWVYDHTIGWVVEKVGDLANRGK